MRRVAKLLQPGSFVELPSDSIEAWRGFREKPAHKVLYLPDGDGAWGKENSTRFEITQNQISRVVPVKREGRIVEKREDVEASFACISTDHRDWMRDSSRWLTMLLDKPPQQTGPKAKSFFHAIPLDEEQTRAMASFAGPHPRTGAAGNHIARMGGPGRRRNLQGRARLSSSFGIPASVENDVFVPVSAVERERNYSAGRFERGLHRFGHGRLTRPKVVPGKAVVPFHKNIFNKVTAEGEDAGFIHPITGKGIRYRHRSKPVRWAPLLVFEEN